MKKYPNKLIQLQILKLYYKKKAYNFKHSLKQIEVHLNKISNIIYKYHITNKKILFIGFPENFIKILHNTKHIVIPEHIWFNGMLSNRISNFSNSNKQMRIPMDIHKLLFKLEKQLDLIIVYNLTNKASAINESYISRLPVITLDKNLDTLKNKATYKTPGNYSFTNEKTQNNELFYSFIKTTLKRAISKKKNKKFNPRYLTKNYYKKYKTFKFPPENTHLKN